MFRAVNTRLYEPPHTIMMSHENALAFASFAAGLNLGLLLLNLINRQYGNAALGAAGFLIATVTVISLL